MTYYTIEEAAQLLKLHPQTLRRWIHQGKLRAKRFGKQYRLRWEEIEQITLPSSEDFDRLALASLAALWDNEEDAIYDDWQELYGLNKG